MISRESLAWGAVGGLSFLVLVQGYELVADVRISFALKGGVALLVAVVSTVIAHVATPRLLRNGRA